MLGSTEGEVGLKSIVARIQDKILMFTGENASHEPTTNVLTGHERVFTVGSRVCYREAGQMTVDVEVIQPTVMDGTLIYQVKVFQKSGKQPVKRWLVASAIEPSAATDIWNYAWWNRETEMYEEPPEGEEW